MPNIKLPRIQTLEIRYRRYFVATATAISISAERIIWYLFEFCVRHDIQLQFSKLECLIGMTLPHTSIRAHALCHCKAHMSRHLQLTGDGTCEARARTNGVSDERPKSIDIRRVDFVCKMCQLSNENCSGQNTQSRMGTMCVYMRYDVPWELRNTARPLWLSDYFINRQCRCVCYCQWPS